MAQDDLTPQEIMRLRTRYEQGTLTSEQRGAFEQEFPHLVPKQTPGKGSRFLQVPSPGGGTFDFPTGEDPEETAGFRSGEAQTMKTIAPILTSLIGGAGGLAGGTALATKLAPYLGRGGLSVLPAAGEAAGSLAARKFNVATGTEEEGMGGDVLATAPSALRLLRPAKQLFVRSLPEAERQILKTQPRLGESATEMILGGKAKGRPYERGKFVQEALEENEQEINAAFSEITAPIKKAVGPLDLADVEKLAKRRGLSLADAESGIEITRGRDIIPPTPPPGWPAHLPVPGAPTEGETFANVTFDRAWHMRSRLQRYIHALEDTDPGKARDYTQLFSVLDQKITTAVDKVGMGPQWREVRQLYKTEFVDRFRTKLYQKVTDETRTSGEELIEGGFKLSVTDVKSLMHSMGRLSMAHQLPPRVSHEAFRTGMIASALEQSVDDATGLLNGRKFFNLFSHMPEDARESLLGKELADALLDFGRETLRGVRRVSFGVGAGGALTTGAMVGGRIGVGAAAETANEFTLIANRIARSPKIMRAITRAVLTSPADRLTRITATDVMRLAGETARPALFQPPEEP